MMSKRDRLNDMPDRRFRLTTCRIARILVRLLYRLEYQGLENVPDCGPAILVANHTSMVDMFAINTAIRPWVCWVAKIELFKNRLTGAVYRKLGCIPVDRNKTDLMAARGIFNALRDKQIVGMFPQGTRVAQDQIPYVHPRNGAVHFAIKTGVPLLPVAISGQFKLFHRVRVIFGEPWQPDLDARKHYESEELDQLTMQMMSRIYALAGIDYHLASQSREG